MKIKKIAHKLGGNQIFIKNIVPKSQVKNIIKTTGIKKIYNCKKNEDIISLAYDASKKIIKKKIDRNIDALIFITETPKYNIPPNSYILHEKLKLKKNCMVFDVNQGCSGYVYGLSLANSLFISESFKNILLVTTDNYSRYCKKFNVKLIFSDCATATLLTKSTNNNNKFSFLSYGKDNEKLKQKYTNYLSSVNKNSLIMDGARVFDFTIKNVPLEINTFLKKNKLSTSDLDFVILHQASNIVLQNLMRKLKVKRYKVLNNISNFGNTVSSSIPMIISTNKKKIKNKKVVLCGFGVGLSIGVSYFEF